MGLIQDRDLPGAFHRALKQAVAFGEHRFNAQGLLFFQRLFPQGRLPGQIDHTHIGMIAGGDLPAGEAGIAATGLGRRFGDGAVRRRYADTPTLRPGRAVEDFCHFQRQPFFAGAFRPVKEERVRRLTLQPLSAKLQRKRLTGDGVEAHDFLK